MSTKTLITVCSVGLMLAASASLAADQTTVNSDSISAVKNTPAVQATAAEPIAAQATPINTNQATDLSQTPSTDNPQTASTPADMTPTPIPSSNTDTQGAAAQAMGLSAKSRFQFNGFLSTGASFVGSKNNAGYVIPEHGTLTHNIGFAPNSLVGIQVTGKLNKQAAIVAQFVASGDDSNGSTAYSVNTKWAFLRYDIAPSVQVRAGRFRLPLFVYSDTQDVGYSYPWVFLPDEVYRIVPLEDMNGVSTLYKVNFGNSGYRLQIQPFYGENSSKYTLIYGGPGPGSSSSPLPPKGAPLTASFKENNIVGGSISFGNTHFTVHAAYAHLDLIPNVLGHAVPETHPNFYSAGIKFDWQNWLLSGEFAKRDKLGSTVADLEGFYAMVGYRAGKILPSFTYAKIKTTNSPKIDPGSAGEYAQNQQSFTLGLNYYISPNLVAKTSGSYIKIGTGGYGLFNAKPGDHAYLYMVSLDAIF